MMVISLPLLVSNNHSHLRSTMGLFKRALGRSKSVISLVEPCIMDERSYSGSAKLSFGRRVLTLDTESTTHSDSTRAMAIW